MKRKEFNSKKNFYYKSIFIDFSIHESRLKALLNAQQELCINETDNESIVNNETLIIVEDRYQIINSCLPTNGDYQIENRMY